MAEMDFLFFISKLIIGFMFWHTEHHFVDKFISSSVEMLGISFIVGVSARIG
ncbi:hypothetical protein [Spiroplasma mirum]|nr:hypothetical protein [Spiroplasma mirum]AHF61177.1 hypothetical protein SMM_0770 [Spiroplasma mirum ATCC 29335]